MEQLHAHEVLHMMEGNSYSEASLTLIPQHFDLTLFISS